MGIIIGICVGLVVGITLHILWKKQFKEFIPIEDKFLINFVSSASRIAIGLISGGLIGSLNKYAVAAGVVLLLLVEIIAFFFGIYFKHIATKGSKF